VVEVDKLDRPVWLQAASFENKLASFLPLCLSLIASEGRETENCWPVNAFHDNCQQKLRQGLVVTGV